MLENKLSDVLIMHRLMQYHINAYFMIVLLTTAGM